MKIVVAFLVGVLLSVGVGAEPVVEGQVRLPDGQPVVGAQVMLIDWDDLRRGAIAPSHHRCGRAVCAAVGGLRQAQPAVE